MSEQEQVASDQYQEFTPEDQALLNRILKKPLILPAEFKSWLYKFASSDAAPHFQEILGTRARRWRIADPIPQLETCSSSSFYSDVATVGPELTGLEDGHYMVIAGFYSQDGTVGTQRHGRIFYNDSYTSPYTPGPAPSAEVPVTTEGQAIIFHVADLSNNNNNSIRMRYRNSADTANYGLRWLHAVQVAET